MKETKKKTAENKGLFDLLQDFNVKYAPTEAVHAINGEVQPKGVGRRLNLMTDVLLPIDGITWLSGQEFGRSETSGNWHSAVLTNETITEFQDSWDSNAVRPLVSFASQNGVDIDGCRLFYNQTNNKTVLIASDESAVLIYESHMVEDRDKVTRIGLWRL